MHAYQKILGPKTDREVIYRYSDVTRLNAYEIGGINRFQYKPSLPGKQSITRRYFVVQIFKRAADSPTVSVQVQGTNHQTHRFSFSSAVRTSQRNKQQIGIIQLDIPSNVWVNLCIDLETVVAQNWEGQSYDSLVSFEINPVCFIRWVFATDECLSPEAMGSDLPRDVLYTGNIRNETVVIPTVPTPRQHMRGSGIPTRSGGRTRPPAQLDGRRPRSGNQLPPKRGIITTTDRPETYNPRADDTDDESEEGAFDEVLPGVTLQTKLPEDEEEELELVYIEGLGCYYCPSNQQYYQLDD